MLIQFGPHDLHKRLFKLVVTGDVSDRLDAVIHWEMFGAKLERIHRKESKSLAGRKPMERAVMFKTLILRSLYGQSDAALEYQAIDGLTFMRPLAIDLAGAASDSKIVCLFPEQLGATGVFDRLFENFQGGLSAEGITLNNGQVVDADVGKPPGGHLKFPHPWPGQNPPRDSGGMIG
ncbi:MAG: transposase [Steroidobacteraceae bacterium]